MPVKIPKVDSFAPAEPGRAQGPHWAWGSGVQSPASESGSIYTSVSCIFPLGYWSWRKSFRPLCMQYRATRYAIGFIHHIL